MLPGWFEFWPKLHWMLIQRYQGVIVAGWPDPKKRLIKEV